MSEELKKLVDDTAEELQYNYENDVTGEDAIENNKNDLIEFLRRALILAKEDKL